MARSFLSFEIVVILSEGDRPATTRRHHRKEVQWRCQNPALGSQKLTENPVLTPVLTNSLNLTVTSCDCCEYRVLPKITLTQSRIWDILQRMKDAVFHPAVRKVVQAMSRDLRKEVGKLIMGLQLGATYSMPTSKTIPSVAKGVEELRIKDTTGAYRIFYLARFKDKVVVFHAFKKKTQKTPVKEIETGRKRLRETIGEEN
jgi:phage-related protein